MSGCEDHLGFTCELLKNLQASRAGHDDVEKHQLRPHLVGKRNGSFFRRGPRESRPSSRDHVDVLAAYVEPAAHRQRSKWFLSSNLALSFKTISHKQEC